MKNLLFVGAACAALTLANWSCQNTNNAATQADTLTLSGLNPIDFKTDSTQLYALRNDSGMEVCFTNFGGRIVSVMVPDRNGKMTDVCLGHSNIADYVKYGMQGCNFGALIGPYANRIARGQFTLDSIFYQLTVNNNGNTLHGGGNIAFHNRIWTAKQIDDRHLQFNTVAPHGEDGFPGNLAVQVPYELGNDNSLHIYYEATTNKPTVVNLTNHNYWNLNSSHAANVLNHEVVLDADKYTAIDSNIVVTGKIERVANTPLDFRKSHAVGERINDCKNTQMKYGKGYDHNFIINDWNDSIKFFGSAYSPETGIEMLMFTTEPGVQFYSANFLDGSIVGKNGIKYPRNSALVFETQHFPDSPNQPTWPSTVLRPGQTYKSHTAFKFATRPLPVQPMQPAFNEGQITQ